ncbi:MAG: NPCBM/NEW2 domain-containing protein, partial [Gemmataceae bacterium]
NLATEQLFAFGRNLSDPKTRDEWKRLVAQRGKRDLFVVRQGEALNPVSGTVLEGNEAGDAIQFEREDSTKVSFKLIRATGGIVFAPQSRGAIPPTLCKATDTLGNTLLVQSVDVTPEGTTLKCVCGATLVYKSPDLLAKLDFSLGNVAFLSDLEPQVQAPEAEPGIPQIPYLRDRNAELGALKLDSQVHAKGLCLFPDTTLVYKLGGDYRELKAVVGIDDAVTVASSSAKLIIEADGKVIHSAVYLRKEKPKLLNLDVKNVRELKLTLERDALYMGNLLTLGDIRVQK